MYAYVRASVYMLITLSMIMFRDHPYMQMKMQLQHEPPYPGSPNQDIETQFSSELNLLLHISQLPLAALLAGLLAAPLALLASPLAFPLHALLESPLAFSLAFPLASLLTGLLSLPLALSLVRPLALLASPLAFPLHTLPESQLAFPLAFPLAALLARPLAALLAGPLAALLAGLLARPLALLASPLAFPLHALLAGLLVGTLAALLAFPLAALLAGLLAGLLAFPLHALLESPLAFPLAGPLAFPLALSLSSPLAALLARPLAALLAGPLAALLAGLLARPLALLASPLAFPLHALLESPLAFPLAGPLAFPLALSLSSPLAALLADPLAAPLIGPCEQTQGRNLNLRRGETVAAVIASDILRAGRNLPACVLRAGNALTAFWYSHFSRKQSNDCAGLPSLRQSSSVRSFKCTSSIELYSTQPTVLMLPCPPHSARTQCWFVHAFWCRFKVCFDHGGRRVWSLGGSGPQRFFLKALSKRIAVFDQEAPLGMQQGRKVAGSSDGDSKHACTCMSLMEAVDLVEVGIRQGHVSLQLNLKLTR
jgi:hypothetical protein